MESSGVVSRSDQIVPETVTSAARHADDSRTKRYRKEAEGANHSWALEWWEGPLADGNAEAKRREYSKGRHTEETRQTFRLGYSPDIWYGLVPT